MIDIGNGLYLKDAVLGIDRNGLGERLSYDNMLKAKEAGFYVEQSSEKKS